MLCALRMCDLSELNEQIFLFVFKFIQLSTS